jgi:hypothetical protein
MAFALLDLGLWVNRGAGAILLCLFGLLVLNVERKEFQGLPIVGKLYRKQGI